MAENKTSKNMEIFAKYLEDNQEVAQRYAAMTPAEKKEFEENFFKQARVERLNQLNRGRNSDEWQLTLDNINMNVLTAMNKAPANLAKMPPQKRRDTIDTILDSFTPEENSQFLTLSNQAKKQLLENFPPKKLVATAQKLEELISQTDNAATKQALTSQFNMVNEEIALTINEIASGKIVIDRPTLPTFMTVSISCLIMPIKRHPTASRHLLPPESAEIFWNRRSPFMTRLTA